jgi:signal transduction histidine kinase
MTGLTENCFFEPFSLDKRQRLQSQIIYTTYPAKSFVFQEGNHADGVYLLISGEVELVKTAHEKRGEVLATVKPGDYFGEIGVIDGSGRSTTARTLGEVQIAMIPAAFFMEALQNEPGAVTIHFLRRVSHHLRTTNNLFIEEVIRKEKMHLLGEMASAIIHDIKSPMTGVQLAVEMIVSEARNERVNEYCKLIQQQIEIISAMAQELLEYSKGHCQLVRQPLNVRDFFTGLQVLNADYLRRANVALLIHAEDFIVEMDRNRIMRVLQNLLTNAVDAYRGQPGTIEVHAVREATNTVQLLVKDNGPGIPEGIRETLFDPFVTHGKEHGTGLGMAIARSIVQAHGGSISFESTTGEGTTFIIRLPLDSFHKL